MTTYAMFVSASEALDTVLGAVPNEGTYGRFEHHPSDAAAIEAARAGGWEICLAVGPANRFLKVWEREDEE